MRQQSSEKALRDNGPDFLTAVDLFAGGGGLTVGLKKAGFSVVGAVEIEPHAYSTYKANHPEVRAFKQDICTVNGASLRRLSPTGRIDLLAGCPPCQGFSSLTSKNKKEDKRNVLIREFGRLVEEIRPRAVMMENVPGLTQRGEPLFKELLEILDFLGYLHEEEVLQVADYGVPQSRRRLVLLGGKGFKILLPEPTHSRFPEKGLPLWKTIESVIKDMPEPLTLSEANEDGGPEFHNWHIVRDLTVQNLRRIRKAKPGKRWTKIPKCYRPACHSDARAGFGNVYGRMTWDQPSPTITGGCTTFSKGRFGHPERDRTISVREAALLQTFPFDYIIDTPYMEYASNIVGNALPCEFAEVLARQCFDALTKEYRLYKNG